MTSRQRRFAELYAGSGNAAQAAREAGYSERTARITGAKLLTKANIAAYIRELQDQAAPWAVPPFGCQGLIVDASHAAGLICKIHEKIRIDIFPLVIYHGDGRRRFG